MFNHFLHDLVYKDKSFFGWILLHDTCHCVLSKNHFCTKNPTKRKIKNCVTWRINFCQFLTIIINQNIMRVMLRCNLNMNISFWYKYSVKELSFYCFRQISILKWSFANIKVFLCKSITYWFILKIVSLSLPLNYLKALNVRSLLLFIILIFFPRSTAWG